MTFSYYSLTILLLLACLSFIDPMGLPWCNYGLGMILVRGSYVTNMG